MLGRRIKRYGHRLASYFLAFSSFYWDTCRRLSIDAKGKAMLMIVESGSFATPIAYEEAL